MSYSGEYITVTDATQEALDLKANLAGGNTFTGGQIVSTLNCKTDLVLNDANSTVKTRKITAVDGNNTKIDVIGSVNLTNEQGESYVHEYKINNVALKTVTETLTNKTIDANSNTINNIKDAIATNDLSIAQTSGLQTELNAKAPINDSILTGETKMTRLTVNHSDTATIGLAFNNTNVNQYAGSFNTSGFGWRFFNNNTNQSNNTTFGVYTKGTGGQLNPLSVKNDGILYTLDQEVKGNVNITGGHEFQIDGADIFTNYRTSADTDTLLALKAPINDSILTGETKMTRLTVNHSDTASIGLDFNNTNVNQYAGSFNTSGYGWRFFNDNTSQLNNTTFGVYTKGTGGQLNPLSVKNDGILYTLDQEVKGNVNLTAGHEFQIDGVNILDAKANDNEVVKITGNQDIDGIKTFEEDMKLEKDLLFTTDDSVIKFGVDSDITLTHTADVGLTTNGDFTVGKALKLSYHDIQVGGGVGGTIAPTGAASGTIYKDVGNALFIVP